MHFESDIPEVKPEYLAVPVIKDFRDKVQSALLGTLKSFLDDYIGIKNAGWEIHIFLAAEGFNIEVFPKNELAAFAMKRIWNSYCKHEIADKPKPEN